MKLSNWVAMIAMSVAIMFIAMVNLTGAADSIRQPASAVRTAYEYDGYRNTGAAEVRQNTLAAADTNKVQETPAVEQPAPSAAQEELEGYDTGTAAPEPPQGWHLPQPCLLQQYNITMGGWLEQGITGNARSPDDRFNGPIATNDRADDYQLNQGWLYFDRPIKNDGEGWDIGGRVDLIYGTDWRFANTLGIENTINAPYQLYGLALPQFYFDVAYNKLTMRFGHWAPSVGMEIVPCVGNFFYSHSYGMAYGQPLLVTGMLGMYKINDQWAINAGMNRGWYMFEDNNHSWDVMGGVEWTSLNKKTKVRFNLDAGPQVDPFGDNERFVYTLTATQQITDKWSYALENDYGIENDAGPDGSDAHWYGLINYLFYTINPKWSAGMRAEWFRDNDGARVFGIGNQPGILGWDGGPGFVGDFTELSLGVNWRPNPNWVLRPEVRWDWYNGSRDVRGNLPFDDGTRSDQFTFATDLILTF